MVTVKQTCYYEWMTFKRDELNQVVYFVKDFGLWHHNGNSAVDIQFNVWCNVILMHLIGSI